MGYTGEITHNGFTYQDVYVTLGSKNIDEVGGVVSASLWMYPDRASAKRNPLDGMLLGGDAIIRSENPELWDAFHKERKQNSMENACYAFLETRRAEENPNQLASKLVNVSADLSEGQKAAKAFEIVIEE